MGTAFYIAILGLVGMIHAEGWAAVMLMEVINCGNNI